MELRRQQRGFRSFTLPFKILLIIAFLLSTASVWMASQLNGSSGNAPVKDAVQLSTEFKDTILQQLDLCNQMIETSDSSLSRRFSDLNGQVESRYARLASLPIGSEYTSVIQEAWSLQDQLRNEADTIRRAITGETGLGDPGLYRGQISRLESEINSVFNRLNSVQLLTLRSALEGAAGNSEAIMFLGGLSISFLLVVIAMTALLKYRVQKPIAQLLQAAKGVRAQDFSVRASPDREDEIGELAREFNYMVASLAASHAELERKVEERTTELRRLQAQLIRSEKMSAIGQLISGVAHELNNPLTAIIGLAELSRRRQDRADAAEDALTDPETLEEIILQAERCSRIVQDLLQFARQREVPFKEVHLNRILDRTIQLRNHELAKRRIKLEKDLSRKDPVVLADPFKLQQVILCLLSNSVDAVDTRGDEGGSVWIRTWIEGDWARFELRDTGTGIEEPERIFDPFYTTKEVGAATGLGLSVSYGIVQEHGGKIEGENWEEGARFIVSLPLLQREPSTEKEDEGQVDATPTPVRALVVDDEQALTRLLSSFLAELGIDSIMASSGAEAVDLLETESVDLVISDIRMPGAVDGLGVYGWLHDNKPELRDRFFFISGDLVIFEEGSDRQLPAPCLRKPFSLEEFSQMIKEVLNQ